MPVTQITGIPASVHHGKPPFGMCVTGISPQSQTVPVTSPRSTVCTLPPLCESEPSGVAGVVPGVCVGCCAAAVCAAVVVCCCEGAPLCVEALCAVAAPLCAPRRRRTSLAG